MRRSDFSYDLPRELIARYPATERSASRLLWLDRAGRRHDRVFRDLPDLLEAGDVLVFNRTRVIPARLAARKPTGGRVEILIERVTGTHEALAQLRTSKTPRPGTVLELDDGSEVALLAREESMWQLRFAGPVGEVLECLGHVPLPPYLERPDEPVDRERYQTVYADRPGAVAAPTAGLHFDAALLDALVARDIGQAFVTLHVGAGTFQPVRSENLDAHRMHAERMMVDSQTAATLNDARASGRRIVAVGTTCVRTLESALDDHGIVQPVDTDTRLFIRPGFRFRVVDAMITNFHLPESTLLMLVSAFAGRERMLEAYAHAVRERYRFFSYGDAMYVENPDDAV